MGAEHKTAVEWGQVAQCTLEAHSFNVRPTAVLLIPKYTVTSPRVCIVRPDPILCILCRLFEGEIFVIRRNGILIHFVIVLNSRLITQKKRP